MVLLICFILLFACFYFLRKISSGKIDQKTENTVIKSQKKLQEIIGILKQIAAEQRAQISKIEDDPFGGLGDSVDIAVVLCGEERGLSRDSWAVQVYVTEDANGCTVELVAIGQGLSAGYVGTYYSGRINMKSSKKRRDIIANRLS